MCFGRPVTVGSMPAAAARACSSRCLRAMYARGRRAARRASAAMRLYSAGSRKRNDRSSISHLSCQTPSRLASGAYSSSASRATPVGHSASGFLPPRASAASASRRRAARARRGCPSTSRAASCAASRPDARGPSRRARRRAARRRRTDGPRGCGGSDAWRCRASRADERRWRSSRSRRRSCPSAALRASQGVPRREQEAADRAARRRGPRRGCGRCRARGRRSTRRRQPAGSVQRVGEVPGAADGLRVGRR